MTNVFVLNLKCWFHSFIDSSRCSYNIHMQHLLLHYSIQSHENTYIDKLLNPPKLLHNPIVAPIFHYCIAYNSNSLGSFLPTSSYNIHMHQRLLPVGELHVGEQRLFGSALQSPPFHPPTDSICNHQPRTKTMKSIHLNHQQKTKDEGKKRRQE